MEVRILIKLVALAISTYSMSFFLLPKALYGEMEAMMANSWWGQKEKERKIHWMSRGECVNQSSKVD